MKLKNDFLEKPNIGFRFERGFRSSDCIWTKYLEYSIEDKEIVLDLCLKYGLTTHYEEFSKAFDMYFNGRMMHDWLINPYCIREELIKRFSYRKQWKKKKWITLQIDRALPELVEAKMNARFETAKTLSMRDHLSRELNELQQKVKYANTISSIIKSTYEQNKDYIDDAELLKCATSAK